VNRHKLRHEQNCNRRRPGGPDPARWVRRLPGVTEWDLAFRKGLGCWSHAPRLDPRRSERPIGPAAQPGPPALQSPNGGGARLAGTER
jgi:hypothetical protein